uniref:G_PROTEIN_RECEP_F2_4 domain-containing protein n=1 Tax=Angiostrongylus cantonensis TaxID=6313 RepID=A0A0K0DPQ8_ANGCA
LHYFFQGSATLLCLLGVTWIFGFLTVINGTGGVVFAWIFTILNCTQGVFIFILHVVMNEKVCSTLARWLRSGICCLPDKTSIDNSKEYTSSRHRIMNIVKANCHSSSTPNTASTDDKEKQLTPISKTSRFIINSSLFCKIECLSYKYKSKRRLQNHLTIKQVATSCQSPQFYHFLSGKTNEWLRCVTVDSYGSPLSSRRLSGNTDTIHDDSMSNDLRYITSTDYDAFPDELLSDFSSSQMSAHRESVEKHAPVKRKKFPLGASEYERGSKDVIVERF